MKKNPIDKYLKEIEKIYKSGDATEHSYRSDLKILIESFSNAITATNEPKRIKCGAPDYIVTQNSVPLGYIEAKDVGKSLDLIEKDAKNMIKEAVEFSIKSPYPEEKEAYKGLFVEQEGVEER